MSHAATLVASAAAGWAAERLLMQRIDQGAAPSVPAIASTAASDQWFDTSDGGSMHWIDSGTGTPLLLLHGVTLDAGVWTHQAGLSESARVCAIDLRGHGESVAGSDGATIEANARDLAELLEHEDLNGVVLAGHSMGGMVVAHFLATAPTSTVERVAGVAFVDSAVRSPARVSAPSDWVRRVLKFPVVSKLIGTVPDNDAGRFAVMAAFGKDPSISDLQTVAASYDSLDPATYWEAIPSILDYDVRAQLAARTDLGELDVVVIVGSRDLLTPQRCADELGAAFAGAKVHVLPGIGHQSMMEAPEVVNALLGDLIAGAGSARTEPGPGSVSG